MSGAAIRAHRCARLRAHGAGAIAAVLTILCVSFGAQASTPPAMQPLQDDELAAVRGADGIAFNLSDFSLTSSATNPFTLTYLSPGGSGLTLSRIDLSRTDDPADPNGFKDPYQLHIDQRDGMSDMIAIDFPTNAAGLQSWSLTTDFSNCSLFTSGACSGTNFEGGTLQVSGLTMKGGGLTLAPSAIADTEGIAFGLGTQLDIASLAVYSRGRTAGDASNTIDTSDALAITGIHLSDATTGGAWTLADVTKHPGLLNAVTDAGTGTSYLHLQIGWPTTPDAVPAGKLLIDNVAFVTNGVRTDLGSSSIASMQINYLDIKFKTGP